MICGRMCSSISYCIWQILFYFLFSEAQQINFYTHTHTHIDGQAFYVVLKAFSINKNYEKRKAKPTDELVKIFT